MQELSRSEKLQLPPEEMREMGYRIIDMLVDYYETQASHPVTQGLDAATLDAIANEPLPEQGTPFAAVLDQFEHQVLSAIAHVDHPRFFAFIPLSNNFVGAMADALAAGYNIFNATYAHAEGAAEIERLTVDWLRQICGMPEGAGGTFVSGGSMANLSALAVARQVHLDGDMSDAVAYCSDQVHFAVSRGMRILGFAPEQLRKIASDDKFRLSLPHLQAEIAADRAAGKRPFCVAATAGTTNTGAIDPLEALADLCERENLWLHVDGAYGAPTRLTERGKVELVGIERAHSLALDAHKWMFQPIECGCLLVRDRRWLSQTFKETAEYLKDVTQPGEELNFMHQGVQLTRRFRALKLWMSIKVFGAAAMRRAIRRGFEFAELAEAILRESGQWEIVTPAQMAIVTFRYLPKAGNERMTNQITEALVSHMQADGFAYTAGTRLREKTVMRLCTNNPRTTEADLRATIRLLERFAAEIESELQPADQAARRQ